WRVVPRLTLTYGFRWDVDFAVSSLNGPSFPAAAGFDLNNLSNLAVAPVGSAPYQTTYGNFAPRLGMAYQIFHSPEWPTVLRGGLGVFYDLTSSEVGNLIGGSSYPYGALSFRLGPAFGGTSTFPLSPADAAPPQIAPPNASTPGRFFALDPHLKQPYTFEWNLAVEQGLGKQQTIS